MAGNLPLAGAEAVGAALGRDDGPGSAGGGWVMDPRVTRSSSWTMERTDSSAVTGAETGTATAAAEDAGTSSGRLEAVPGSMTIR